MPTEDGVRRHECRDLRKHSATQTLSQVREASSLTVLEPEALSGQPRLQDAILLPQRRDDNLGLLPMEPSTQGCDQQLERKHRRSLRYHHGPVVGLRR